MIQVELGSGTKTHPQTTYGIDLTGGRGAPPQDAARPGKGWLRWQDELQVYAWRLRDESVDHVYASHFMEHVPKGAPTIHVMNEAWRVLRPGGAFTALLPVIGVTQYGENSLVNAWEPYADPTHVQGWWLPQSWHYFTGQQHFDAEYGIDVWSALPDEPAAEAAVTALLAVEAGGEELQCEPFWTLRGGWEAVVRLVKP